MSSERERRVAFVVEDWDMEAELLAARFSVRWEEREGRGRAEGPAGVSLDEALAWGRGQATVVYVQLDGAFYSAGSEQRGSEDDEDLLPWPEEGLVVRPRPPGTPLDGSVQSRPWELRGWIEVEGRDVTEATTAALRDALREDERFGAVEVSRLEDDGMLVSCTFEARSAGLAIRTTHPFLDQLLERLGIAGFVTRVVYTTDPHD